MSNPSLFDPGDGEAPASPESGTPLAEPATRRGSNRRSIFPFHVVWAPGMRIRPHDHLMWAAIGLYAGQEDNTFYRRADGHMVPAGGPLAIHIPGPTGTVPVQGAV